MRRHGPMNLASRMQSDEAPARVGKALSVSRLLGSALAVAMLYYVGLRLGNPLELSMASVSALLLAALLLSSPSRWWIYVVAVFPAHVGALYPQDVPLGMVLGGYFCNIAEALLASIAVGGWGRAPLNFARCRDVHIFLACCVIMAPALAAFPYATLVVATAWHYTTYWQSWLQRAVSDALSALIVVPPVLITAQRGKRIL